MWVVAILAGVREPGAQPTVGREICRIWLPLGAAVSQGLMRVVANEDPTSDDMPPFIQSFSFDFVQACVKHGRSLYDEDFIDWLDEHEL